jgi:hypothetical protein
VIRLIKNWPYLFLKAKKIENKKVVKTKSTKYLEKLPPEDLEKAIKEIYDFFFVEGTLSDDTVVRVIEADFARLGSHKHPLGITGICFDVLGYYAFKKAGLLED